ncbi:MAG TPA: sialidase family protein, partial [Polyangia bacterium]|nr:sialidase family protein [Polyangia bacterium]
MGARSSHGVRALTLLATAAPLLLGARAARADGAFPDSLGILAPAQLPDETLLATNFGLVMSFDRDQTWVWACEQGANNFAILYQMGPAPRNRIFAVSPTNLIFSDDSSCTWTASVAGATDAFVDPTNADRVLAVVAVSLDGGGITYTVVESSDGGATFPQLRYTAPAGDHITGVEISRSQPQTVYLTLTSSTYAPMVAVTTNGGGTWAVHDLTASLPSGTYSLRLVAVDPGNPQKLFMRAGNGTADALAISTDGGVTATTALSFSGGVFAAFARLASGSLVAGGVLGDTSVAYRSTDGGGSFQQLPPVPFNFTGLAARGAKLYGASENMLDPYAIYTSIDEGMSWQPLMAFDQNIQAIPSCLRAYCQTDCETRAGMGLFSDDDSDAVCSAAVVPASIDGGADGPPPVHDAGHPGGTGSGGSGGAGTGTGGAATGTGSTGGGCHCGLADTVGGGAAASWSWLLLAAVLAGARRRR